MAKRGRKPSYIDVYCPNPDCHTYRGIKLGNIVSNGTYKTKSGRVHKFICRECNKVFCERQDTIFYDLRTEEEKILLALKLLVKGMSLRGTAEVLGTKLDTIRHWLRLAAKQSEKVSQILIKNIEVSRVQLDELWTFVKKNELRKRSMRLRKMV